MIKHCRYECELCRVVYDEADQARACEAAVPPPRPTHLSVGQSIVVRVLRDGAPQYIARKATSLFVFNPDQRVGNHQWAVEVDYALVLDDAQASLGPTDDVPLSHVLLAVPAGIELLPG